MAWIWSNKQPKENSWVNFVKDLYLEHVPESGKIKIAVDTKYWLYVNGKLVIFEGGIKRGPGFYQTYYDEVDIGNYLISGTNRIAILVWYFGKSGFSHCSSGHGGLYVTGNLGGYEVTTNSSWKCIDNLAYVDADESDVKPNFRLAEPNIYYDATKEIDEWYTKKFDVSNWEDATEIKKDYWGVLTERGIPQWKNSDLLDYQNSNEIIGKKLLEETIVKMYLPYNAQITPYFDIETVAGQKIDIYTDTYDTIFDEEKNIKSVYYTKEGRQIYESLGWINGEIVYYHFPAQTLIHSLKYRETGYASEFIGNFICKDDFFNKLYEKCRRTLYITMRDTFMDCPDRERVQWWGDVNLEMQMMFYCLDDQALLLYEKGARSMVNWAEYFGNMITVVPSGTEEFELPFQNLAGIYGFYYYYQRTKKVDFLKNVYQMSRDYVLSYSFAENHLVEHKKGSWDWADWGENEDIAVMENAWVFLAAESCLAMAEVLGSIQDVLKFRHILDEIGDHFYKNFWTGNAFYFKTKNNKPDDRANALAVLTGLVHKEDYEKLINIFNVTYNASPYMEKYVLDAMCEMGYLKDALKRIKIRYKEMVEDQGTTLWEYWNKNGTRNHAWSGGPLIILKKYEKQVKELIENEE